MPFDYPTWLDELLKRLGATLVPIALVSVGYQLQLSLVQGQGLALTVGLLFKLVIAPTLKYHPCSCAGSAATGRC